MGRPWVISAAAAAIVVALAAGHGLIAAAVAEKQDQQDDPDPVVAAEAGVAIHNEFLHFISNRLTLFIFIVSNILQFSLSFKPRHRFVNRLRHRLVNNI